MVEFLQQGDDRLWRYLAEQIPQLDHATEAQRDRLLCITRALIGRSMPTSVILSSVRSTAGVLDDLDAPPHPDDVMQREEVRRFIAENAVPRTRRERLEPGREARRTQRERLYNLTTAAIRDARSSKARHEIKKTRNVLMKIDQRELRRVLGKEADDLCRQINTILREMAPLF
jgi:hypothetical protein